jgi:hypothetical protein
MTTLRMTISTAALAALALVGCRKDLDNDPAGRNPGSGAPTPSYSPTDRVGSGPGETAPDELKGTVKPDEARGLPGTSGTIGQSAPASAPATTAPSSAGAMNGTTGAAGTTAAEPAASSRDGGVTVAPVNAPVAPAAPEGAHPVPATAPATPPPTR